MVRSRAHTQVDIGRHNEAQLKYFERAGMHAMKPSRTPYIRRQVDELVRFGELEEGERVLDVGCGMGRYTFELAERGLEVEGLDLSEDLLRRFRSFDEGRYEIPLYCADILAPPIELGGRFDAVVGFFTLHHLHDLSASFQAMDRLLKRGGRIVFLEPNPLNVLYYIQMIVVPGMSWQGDKGILRMRPDIVFAAMHEAGLTELSVRRFGLFPPFLTNHRLGARAEDILQRAGGLQRFLAFQLFRGDRLSSSTRSS